MDQHEDEVTTESAPSWTHDLEPPAPGTGPAARGKALRRAAAASAIVAGLGASAYGLDAGLSAGSPSAAAASSTASLSQSTAGTSPSTRAGEGFEHGLREGPPAAFGTVVSVGTKSFTVKTAAGTTVTVDVSSTTTYRDFGVTSASLANVKANEKVAVFGTSASGIVTAKSVVIGRAGEGFEHGGSWRSDGGAGSGSGPVI
jgi:hypothetical protein